VIVCVHVRNAAYRDTAIVTQFDDGTMAW